MAWNPENDLCLHTIGTITPDPENPDNNITIALHSYTSAAAKKKGEHGEIKLALSRSRNGRPARLGRLSRDEATALIEALQGQDTRSLWAEAGLVLNPPTPKRRKGGKKRSGKKAATLQVFVVEGEDGDGNDLDFFCLCGGKKPGGIPEKVLTKIGFAWDGEDDNAWYVDATIWVSAAKALKAEGFKIVEVDNPND